MYPEIEKMLQRLAEDSVVLNPDVRKAYAEPDWLTVWTEGGEWPAYDPEYDGFSPGPVCRSLIDIEYVIPPNLEGARNYIASAFDSGQTVVALSMDCGTGKSTKLAMMTHGLKLGVRTFVVQPSLGAASNLSEFVSDKQCYYARCASEMPDGRSLVYTNGGAMVDMILRSQLRIDDVVILDEAHTVTCTYELLVDLLTRCHNRVLVMTASTSSTIKALRGVKLEKVDGFTSQVSDRLGSEPASVIVGVLDNLSYAAPANVLIGATMPLRTIFDTGLRPEPRVTDDGILFGERLATWGEIIQMMGRLGRLGVAGKAFYNPDARPIAPTEGAPLYDVMLSFMKCAIGISNALAPEKARDLWAASGLLKNASNSHKRYSRGRNDKRSSVGSPPPEYDRVCDVERVRRYEKDPDVQNLFRDTRANDNVDTGYDRVEQSLARPSLMGSKYHTTKRHSRHGSEYHLSVRFRDTNGNIVDGMRPNPEWRPFRRFKGELVPSKNSSDVSLYLDKIRKANDRGDMLFVSPLPQVYSGHTTTESRADARMILAGRLLPEFTELEAMSVIVEWNRLVVSLDGSCMPPNLASQFVNYFTRLCANDGIRIST